MALPLRELALQAINRMTRHYKIVPKNGCEKMTDCCLEQARYVAPAILVAQATPGLIETHLKGEEFPKSVIPFNYMGEVLIVPPKEFATECVKRLDTTNAQNSCECFHLIIKRNDDAS